jgi:hypothetical protein
MRHCDLAYVRVYRLHQSELQRFTEGSQVLVTGVCLPASEVRACHAPGLALHGAQGCQESASLLADVVSRSSGAIQDLRDPRADKIVFGFRLQTFVAAGVGSAGGSVLPAAKRRQSPRVAIRSRSTDGH